MKYFIGVRALRHTSDIEIPIYANAAHTAVCIFSPFSHFVPTRFVFQPAGSCPQRTTSQRLKLLPVQQFSEPIPHSEVQILRVDL